MKRRVVVTGVGAVTPIGNTAEEFWDSLTKKKVGIGPNTLFDTSDYKAKLDAEVRGFAPEEYMPRKEARRMERFSQFAVACARMAVEDAGLEPAKEDPYRMGISVGAGIGSIELLETNEDRLKSGGPKKIHPLFIPKMISNMAAGNISIQLGMKGKCIDVVTACASGTHSIGEAFRTIQYGDADIMVAGGTEACITPLTIAGFQAMTALSTSEDPLRASIPFDKERDGFVIGEGAGIVLLEELEHARKRGAKIYCELAGYGATSDAYHITSPAEDGSGDAKAMEMAMKDAGVTPEQVQYINAHGTGTHHNDLFETRAIRRAFGEQAPALKISSTKSMIGHLLGGAGGAEAVACVKTIEKGFVHATAGYQVPDEECDLDYVTGDGVPMEVDCCLSNSMGFGGHNAVLCFKRLAGA